MTQQMASGTGLIEKTAETGAPAPVRRGPRFFWVLLAAIVAAVALLAVWTVLQTGAGEQLVDEPPRVLSHHDSGIAMRLREQAAPGRAGHDSGIAGLVRERRGAQAAHDSGIAAALRDRAASAYDSGIAAALRDRAGPGHDGTGCGPEVAGQGGWEARLSLGC